MNKNPPCLEGEGNELVPAIESYASFIIFFLSLFPCFF